MTSTRSPVCTVGRTLLAKVVIARAPLALHQVFYRPNDSAPPDYLICQQAGFILRLFENPPEKRFEFASALAGQLAVEQLVKAHPVVRLVPAQQLPKLCDMLRDGLLNHLRSIPVGMRVDRWLANDLNSLAEGFSILRLFTEDERSQDGASFSARTRLRGIRRRTSFLSIMSSIFAGNRLP